MSYFAKPKNETEKNEHDFVSLKESSRTEMNEAVSTLGPGMLIKGNIVCEGPMQVFGRIVGEIHAVKLTIGKGGYDQFGKRTARKHSRCRRRNLQERARHRSGRAV